MRVVRVRVWSFESQIFFAELTELRFDPVVDATNLTSTGQLLAELPVGQTRLLTYSQTCHSLPFSLTAQYKKLVCDLLN